tara:strand:- start:31 stop:777 length:747 start_codon:yes stop_codon:yes gene_type:complete
MKAKRRILVTGGNGVLAQEIKKTKSNYEILCISKKEMDVCNLDEINSSLDKYKPNYIIHAGAFTRPMKKHQEFPVKSISTNIIGTSNVVLSCLERKIKMIYISTDYVYPGTEGNYKEDSGLSPYSVVNDGISKYGWSKLGGECAVRFLKEYLIIRACLSEYPFPHDKALTDIKKSYMYSKDAASIILRLLDLNGIINLGGEAKSPYEFSKLEKKDVKAISLSDIVDVKIAPDTSLDLTKLKNILKGSI